MVIKSLGSTDKKPVVMDGAERAFRQVPIGKADGTPNISFRVFTLEPGGHTPYHVHESEHVNYIIRGQGTVKDVRGELHAVQTGDFILILPNEKHQYRNTSPDEEFVFICAVMKEYE